MDTSVQLDEFFSNVQSKIFTQTYTREQLLKFIDNMQDQLAEVTTRRDWAQNMVREYASKPYYATEWRKNVRMYNSQIKFFKQNIAEFKLKLEAL